MKYLEKIKEKLGSYKYNEVKYLIGLFATECSLAHINPKYKSSVKQADNLRQAFIEGCWSQMDIDKKWNVI